MGQFLSGPCTLVETEECSGDNMSACVGAMQGWRVNMEDSHILLIGLKENATIRKDTALFAVFDGHGGKEVAMFAESKFEEILVNLPAYKEGKYEDALRIAFHRVDELLEDLQYDEILKTYKKLPNPVAYALDVQQKPVPSVEKVARNIKFQTKLMRRLGLTDDPLNVLPKPNQAPTPPPSFKKMPISPRSQEAGATAVVVSDGTATAASAETVSEDEMLSLRDTEVDVSREMLKQLSISEEKELDPPPAWTVAPAVSSTIVSSSSSSGGSGEGESEATLAPIFVPENAAVLVSDHSATEPEKPQKPNVCRLVNHRYIIFS